MNSTVEKMDKAAANHAIKQYVAGFAGSIVLTLLAYIFTVNEIVSGWNLAYLIMGLALVQLIVQLVCFMHIGQEEEPRWKLLVFDFTLVIIIIVVFGTLWIMKNLDQGHTTMTPQQTKTYMHEHEGL